MQLTRMAKEEVYYTRNYSVLKKLLGNREVKPQRIKNMIESINQHGYINVPIIVNEKLEIIEGQTRAEALEELGMEIPYKIIPNLGIKECRALNQYQKKWTIDDYVSSLCARKNNNYINYRNLYNEYPNNRNLLLAIGRYQTIDNIKKGDLVVSNLDYAKAKERLSFAYDMRNCFSKIIGSDKYLYQALIEIHQLDVLDIKKLSNAIKEKGNRTVTITNIREAILCIETIYNSKYVGSRKKYIFDTYRVRKTEEKKRIQKRLKASQ